MPTRFLILGLPRSGTTYLMDLLNSHPRIRCAGELFNPYKIIDFAPPNEDLEAVCERDADPEGFAERFFLENANQSTDAIGFKLMIGHNLDYLKSVETQTDLRLIWVRRENRLAQAASLIRALKTKEWARLRKTRDRPPLEIGPKRISHIWQEKASFDYFFGHWFATLPHRKMSLEYTEMFAPGFEQRVCEFLGQDAPQELRSRLVKQGSNRIIDRFQWKPMIESYMKQMKREDWLDEEIR